MNRTLLPGDRVCLSHRMDVEATLVAVKRSKLTGKRIATIRFDNRRLRRLSVKGIRKAKPPEPTIEEMYSQLMDARGWDRQKVLDLADGNGLTVRDVYRAVFCDQDH